MSTLKAKRLFVVAGAAISVALVGAASLPSVAETAGAAPPAATPSTGAPAAASKPTAVDVLFETKHLANLKQGEEAKYRFQRIVSDPKLLGTPFSDEIALDVTKLNPDGTREVTLKVFTGERARDPQVVPDMSGNPLLVLFLDRAVNNFQSLAGGGNHNYLKGKFREGLRDKAKIEPTKIDYKGQKIDGYKVTLAPYENDPNALRMLGYEGAEFTFLLSPGVPGEIAELVAHYESGIKDAPTLEERITLAGIGGAK